MIRRVRGLDGLRGLAALYVVLFHCWLLSFRGFPANRGPAEFGWLLYGHLSVVFFLALSGFSLALSASAHGWRVGNLLAFARRRAWRILPAYWAALTFSLLIAYFVVPASHRGAPTLRTVGVYALMLQDVFKAPTPNGAFWSIAVEAELYLVFPLIVLLRRRLGAVALLGLAFLPVIAIGALTHHRDGVNHLAFGLGPVFVAGVVAAGAVGRRDLPWHWLTLLTGVPVLGLLLVKGSTWNVHHYFWIDLAIAPALAFLILAVANGRPAFLREWLDSRPLRGLGDFSYSLYLIHLPIVMLISRELAIPLFGRGPAAMLLTMAAGVPLSLLSAWLFAKVFERRRFSSRAAAIPAGRNTTPAPAVPPAGKPVTAGSPAARAG